VNAETAFTTKVRNWLIRRLAGSRTIVLNARFDLVDQDENEGLHLEDLKEAMVWRNQFAFPYDDLALRIRPFSAGEKP
jgi:hypothetical protein